MYGGPRPRGDREVTWRSVTAGFLLNVAFLAVLVAISHPVATGAVVATGLGLYAVREAIQRATYERTVQVCRPGICFRFQVRLG